MNKLFQGEGSEPVGWRLVPIEPTPEMLNVTVPQPIAVKGTDTETIRWHLWQAMLAAAPSPPLPPAGNADPFWVVEQEGRYFVNSNGEQTDDIRKARQFNTKNQADSFRRTLPHPHWTAEVIEHLWICAPKSAGNADPRVREALEENQKEIPMDFTADQIKYMVDRFLSWRLPENFSPDNGISYARPSYHPSVDATPLGTNLLDATQAELMVRHITDGLPALPSPQSQGLEDGLVPDAAFEEACNRLKRAEAERDALKSSIQAFIGPSALRTRDA